MDKNMETLLPMLGWCTLINFAMLSISTITLVCCGDWIMNIHKKLFRINDSDLQRQYFGYLAHYKILITVFNLVPYIALRIIGT